MANHALDYLLYIGMQKCDVMLSSLWLHDVSALLMACKRKRNFIDSQSRSQLEDNDYLFLKSAMEALMIRDGLWIKSKPS
jgi:hypothetical protein